MLELVRIALRNLARNKRRTALALAAVLLSAGVMVTLRGLVNGVQNSIKETVIGGMTGSLQVHKKGYAKKVLGGPLSLNIPADDAFLARLRAVPHVTAASARIMFGAMANAHDVTTFAMVFGVDPRAEYLVCPHRRDLLKTGAGLSSTKEEAALLAGELARRLGLALGDQGALLAADPDGVMNGVDFSLGGTLGSNGLPGVDTKVAFVPLSLAQRLLHLENRATEIAIAIDDDKNLGPTRDALQAALGADFEVTTWHDVAHIVDEVMSLQEGMFSILIAIFLIVALLGIANTMLMSVLERTREIGTMMAVGVRRWQILVLFIVEAAALGLLGSLLGGILGSAVTAVLHRQGISFELMNGVDMLVRPSIGLRYVLRTGALAMAGAMVAAIYPAWKGSRMRPVEALAHV